MEITLDSHSCWNHLTDNEPTLQQLGNQLPLCWKLCRSVTLSFVFESVGKGGGQAQAVFRPNFGFLIWRSQPETLSLNLISSWHDAGICLRSPKHIFIDTECTWCWRKRNAHIYIVTVVICAVQFVATTDMSAATHIMYFFTKIIWNIFVKIFIIICKAHMYICRCKKE